MNTMTDELLPPSVDPNRKALGIRRVSMRNEASTRSVMMVRDHVVITDEKESNTGPTPLEMTLSSLCGCEGVIINRCAEASANVDWSGLRLYTTAEPCCMCQAAILWAGIPEVFFGTSMDTLLRLGWNQIGIPAEEVAQRTPFANCKLTGGILEQECDALFEACHRSSPR